MKSRTSPYFSIVAVHMIAKETLTPSLKLGSKSLLLVRPLSNRRYHTIWAAKLTPPQFTFGGQTWCQKATVPFNHAILQHCSRINPTQVIDILRNDHKIDTTSSSVTGQQRLHNSLKLLKINNPISIPIKLLNHQLQRLFIDIPIRT